MTRYEKLYRKIVKINQKVVQMKTKYKVIYYYSEDDQCYLAFAPELPGCCADGNTVEEAVANLDVITLEWIEMVTDLGREVPELLPETFETSETDIFAVAKYILEQTGSISTMTLEKLTYYCLVWSLVWYNQPLFKNNFQAWRRGPVCKELFDYHRGRRVISASMIDSTYELSRVERKIVDCILEVYGSEDGEFLSALTHNEAPWNITRGELPEDAKCEKVITNELIRQSYMY